MQFSEEEMTYLEEHIPDLAEPAFRQAFWAALAAGQSVLISEGGFLVRVHPDGSRQTVKPIPLPVNVNFSVVRHRGTRS